MQSLLYPVDNLKSRVGVNGQSLFDNTIIVAASEFVNPHGHDGNNSPHLLIGGGNRLRLGQNINLQGQATINDLYKTIAKSFGVNLDYISSPELHRLNLDADILA